MVPKNNLYNYTLKETSIFSVTLEKKKKYLGHIESLRAVAALMVMLFHFISFTDANGPLIANESVRKYSEFGAQGVELFYIISGFVIYYSLTTASYGFKQYPKYLLKRILRIFPPFWGTIILICITPFFFHWPFPYKLTEILQNATLAVDLFKQYSWMNPIFQTLKVEFLFYLIIGLLAVLLKKSNWSYGIITFSSLIGAYYYHSIDLVHNVPFFLIGIACCEIYKSQQLILNYSLIAACLFFLYLIFPLEDVIISIIGVVFLVWIRIKNRWVEQIGQFSYSIYLTHGFSGGLFLFYCKNQEHVDWNPYVYITIALIGALIFAFCYYRVVERRAISWSKKIRY